MHPKRYRLYLRCLYWATMLAAFALLVGSATALASDISPPVPGSVTSAGATPIAASDILTRAEEEQQRVDRATRLLAGPDPVAQLRKSLDDIARPVDDRLRAASAMPLRRLPVMRLESLARHWEFDRRRFERWEKQAQLLLAPFGQSALELGQSRAAWSATRAEGMLEEMPPVLSNRVDSVITQLDVTEAALGSALEPQFALTRRASELKSRIEAGQREVAAAIDDIDRRLLAVDAPPLWLALGTGVGSESALDAMHYGMDIERQFARDYHAAGTGNQQALRVLQCLLLPLILWLVARSRHARLTHAETGLTSPVLHRPISMWLLLSMLSVLVLEPDAPLLVHEFALALALVPLLRLLPAPVLRALGIWPYIAVGLYALDRLCMAAVLDGGSYRLLLLVLNLLALVLTCRMVARPLPPLAGERDRKLQRAVRNVGWVVLAVLLVAVVANVAGNVSLAEMLTSGVIDSGYMALLLYAGVTACLTMLRALLDQPELAGRRLVNRQAPMLQTVSRRLLMLAAFIGWLIYSAERFRMQRPLQELWATIGGLGIEIGEVSIHVGNIAVFGLASLLAVWVARGVRRLLHDELPGHTSLPRGVGNSIASLSYYGVLLSGLLVALSAAGFKVSQLTLVFGALGVGIGFGLQNVVNHFVSGLVLMFERPIQPGDVVDAAGSSGTVREIGLRATTIRTFDGADIIVPNGQLLNGNLTNWTMHDHHRRIEITVRVAFTADPARVLALLNAAAHDTRGVAEHPAPMAMITGFGDSAMTCAVRAWTDDIDTWLTVRSDLFANTLAVLQAAGIPIAFNQMDLHVHADALATKAR